MKALLLALLLIACAVRAEESPRTDPARVAQAGARVAALPYLDAIIVAQHGAKVFEHYRRASERDSPHAMRSATKSVISAALGIALGPRSWQRCCEGCAARA